LLASGDLTLRLYKAGAVVLGYLSHLALDEFYSLEWHRGRLRLKKSFGSALKLFSTRRIWPNVSTFAKLALLTYIVMNEPGWIARHSEGPFGPGAHEQERFIETANSTLDRILR